jgi:hypothetical protein
MLVPAVPAGAYVVSVTTPVDGTVTQPFQVLPGAGQTQPTATPQLRSVTLHPQAGAPGASVSLQGTGFTSGQPATLTFNRGVIGTVPVSTDGTITAAFAVPAVPAGTYLVGVTTSSDGTITQPFQVLPAAGQTQPTTTPSGCHLSC